MNIKTVKATKEFQLADVKAAEENGVLKISGYANNKGVADRYGDIPTEYNRDYVYELEEFKRNPVLLLDHYQSVANVAGKVTDIYEDGRGLYFEAELSASDLPAVKHARQLIKEGTLKTVSNGGIWSYEDLQNPSHLTLAKIFEISLVAIPADTFATFAPQTPADEPAKRAGSADFKEMADKLEVFKMKCKINQFEAKLNKPANGQGA